jgi:hypothetical protein
MTAMLIQPLFDGPIDIVGDVHGEIDALRTLLHCLGYSTEGVHPEGRRLVFVGDLVDRGPDSPAVIELVRRLIEGERAQCVLGNHELNILIGNRKADNVWFFHHESSTRSQVQIQESARPSIRSFFATLPLALERPDLRVVHACWDDAAMALSRRARQVVELHDEHRVRIDDAIRRRGLSDRLAKLSRQNDNPVKLLTSGPEALADKPFEAMGQVRHERRVAWWRDYRGPRCVFGHYWRILLRGEADGERLFADVPRNALLGRGEAMCVDYSVGKRYLERAASGFDGVFQTRLAALRWPERRLIFDDGQQLPLRDPSEPRP